MFSLKFNAFMNKYFCLSFFCLLSSSSSSFHLNIFFKTLWHFLPRIKPQPPHLSLYLPFFLSFLSYQCLNISIDLWQHIFFGISQMHWTAHILSCLNCLNFLCVLINKKDCFQYSLDLLRINWRMMLANIWKGKNCLEELTICWL